MRRWWARRPGRGRATEAPSSRLPDDGTPIGRRVVLGLFGLGALGIVTGTRAQNAVVSVLAPIQLRDPTGLTSLLPVGDTFRFYSVTGGVPTKDATSYRLVVNGLVDRPTTLTLADLQAMPQTSLVRDFQCVTGWRVPQVHWSGVRLSTILDHAGVQADGQALRLSSFDGTYTDSLTLDQARLPDVIVALRMLGGDGHARPRRPGAALRRAHVRLQEREVAVRHRGDRPGDPRLLGAPRVRRGRVRRLVERTKHR